MLLSTCLNLMAQVFLALDALVDEEDFLGPSQDLSIRIQYVFHLEKGIYLITCRYIGPTGIGRGILKAFDF